MTREEALEKLSSIEINEGDWVIGYHLVSTEELIEKIYNDHEKNREEWIIQGDQLVSAHKHECMAYEAQLKAQEELLNKLHKAYAEAEYECKAKDEKLKQLDDAYSKVASDFESAVMEIERLKQALAWKLLCTDMAYGLHQYDTWEDVPNTTKESYLKNVSKD